MRTVQVLENAIMYDLLHFRLNTLGSFLTSPHMILSFLTTAAEVLGIQSRLSLSIVKCVKHQSLGTISTLLGCHIRTCMQKGVPATLSRM